MKPIEALVLLFCAIVALVLLGRRFNVPYPIALVIGGLFIGFTPGLPAVHISPDLVFLVFLPPLLYSAGWFTSWHDFRNNLRPIFLLAVGLVLFTTLVTGCVLHALIPGISLAVAFAFGAIVSPPDAVAATAIAEQMSLPKRIATVLEGESLVNDATGLVALRFALAAAASGTFSIVGATFQFAWAAVGGLALGLLVAMATTRVLRFVNNDSLIITISLMVPYIAYLPAERLHMSGVLATVAAGIYGGWKGPELLTASARLSAVAVWSLLVFLLNCFLFILIGLALPDVIRALKNYSLLQLSFYAVTVSAIVILIRILWVFPATWLPRLFSKRLRKRDPLPPWRHIAILAWSGMRGVVSLAAALALPLSLGQGRPLPDRDLLIFLTFCVIFSTLILQGLSLPWLIRKLRVKEQKHEARERDARLKIARAALARLNEQGAKSNANEAALQRVIALYQERIVHFEDELAAVLGWSPDHERLISTRQLWLQALEAERNELVKLRRGHQIEEDLMHKIEHEIDLEETRLRNWSL